MRWRVVIGPGRIPALARAMPTLTVSPGAIKALGCSAADVREPALTTEAKRALEPLLVSFGFQLDRVIRVVQLATGGFVLAQ
jgi:hypothetical protein